MARSVLIAHLGQHHDALRAGSRVLAAEHGDATAPNAGEVAHRLFELVGADVAAAADDDVLLAAGEKQHPFGEVGAVPGVHPFAVEQRFRRRRIAVVAGGGRRAAELQQSFLPVGQFQTRGVHRANVVAGDRRAAADHDQRRRVFGSRFGRLTGSREAVPVKTIRAPRAARHGDRDAHRGFGEAVGRRQAVLAQPEFREALLERHDRLRADRLGGVEREAPGREIDALHVLVRNPAQAEFEGEVRAAGHRAAVAVDRAHPARRPRQERERRHQHRWKSEHQRGEVGADESEVVIQRQPAHEHVIGACVYRRAHRAHVGHQVGVREHHALGRAGAARGVLQKTRVARLAVHRTECCARGFLQVGRNQNQAQRLHLRPQQVGERFGLRHGDHDHRPGALQDPDMARHVVLDRGQAGRRVERHRHSAREQHTVERVQVFFAGGQHDRHHLAALEARAREPGRVADRAVPERAVGERKLLLVLVHEYREPVRLALDVVFERFGQRARLCLGRRAHAFGLHKARHSAVRRLARVASVGEQETQQVARRFACREGLLGQARAELLLQAQH